MLLKLNVIINFFSLGKSGIQKAGVQYIIDSVLKELLLDPQKR
jgi:hypothetical protein